MSVTPYASPSPSPGATPWVPLWPLSPGGMSGLTVLYDTQLAAVANDIDITNIPQTFRSLRLVVSLRGTAGALAITSMQFNGDTNAASYYAQQLRGFATTADALNIGGSAAKLGNMPGANASAGYFGSIVADLPYYSGAQPKTSLAHWYRWTADNDQDTGLVGALWKQTAPITRIRIFPDAGQWAAGSRVTLYGVDPMSVQIPTVNPSYGTSFPASPIDGQEHILVDSITAPTYQWRFRYNALSGSAYKWEFVGGADAISDLAASVSTASGAAVDLGGPSITLPRNGDYIVSFGARNDQTNVISSPIVSLYQATALRAADFLIWPTTGGVSAGVAAIASTIKLAGLVAAAGNLHLRYSSSNGTSTLNFTNRWLRIQPVRVS